MNTDKRRTRNPSQIGVRFDPTLLKRLHAEAKRQRRSLANFIRCTMEDALKGRS